MVNKLESTQSTSGCPMNRIKIDSDDIKQKCHDLFGKPFLKLNNNMGGVDGKKLISFLENFLLNHIQLVSKTDLGKMESVQLIGSNNTSDMQDAEIMWRQKDSIFMSKLGYMLYGDFIQSYKHLSIKRSDFYGLSKEFFQAFDSILLTGAFFSTDMKEWGMIKDDMKKIAINLSQIPTGIQTSMSSPSIKLNNKIASGYPYVIADMKGLWDFGESQLGSLKAWIDEEKGGYGRCPAAEDGTLLKAFDILFEIYGELLVKPKEEK